MFVSEIDVKIQTLRRQRHLTQAELGKRLGISKSIISAYERGVNLPPYETLVAIADIFNVSTDYLLRTTKGQTLSVEGLSPSQVDAVNNIIQEFLRTNASSGEKDG